MQRVVTRGSRGQSLIEYLVITSSLIGIILFALTSPSTTPGLTVIGKRMRDLMARAKCEAVRDVAKCGVFTPSVTADDIIPSLGR